MSGNMSVREMIKDRERDVRQMREAGIQESSEAILEKESERRGGNAKQQDSGETPVGTSGTMTFIRIVGLPAAAAVVFLASASGPDVARTALPILIGLLVATYLLPTIEGAIRAQPNILSIAIVNIFLGWSLLGWVVAMAWACAGSDKPKNSNSVDDAVPPILPTPPIAKPAPVASIADELQKLAALRDQGVLTEDEFNQQKSKLLA